MFRFLYTLYLQDCCELSSDALEPPVIADVTISALESPLGPLATIPEAIEGSEAPVSTHGPPLTIKNVS